MSSTIDPLLLNLGVATFMVAVTTLNAFLRLAAADARHEPRA